MGLTQLLKLASVVLFFIGFTTYMGWLDIPTAELSPFVVMAIGAGLAFLAGKGLFRWIGLIIFAIGFGIQFDYIDLEDYISNVHIGGVGLMVTGYLFIFFN